MSEVATIASVPPLDMANVEITCKTVMAEVHRQDILARAGRFGGYHVLVSGPNERRLPVLMEEVGEVSRELNEALIKGELDRDHLVTELIQVAACAVAWASAIEGNGA